MLGSRPDLCFPVSFFSQFQDRAADIHYNYLLRVLKYVYHSRNLELVFNAEACEDDRIVTAYSDADWSNCILSRKSYSGNCVFVYGNLVSWSSRKQGLIALSSTESELVSLCELTTEVIWIKRLLSDLAVDTLNKCVVFEDNQSCLRIIKSGKWNTKRSKHIDVKYRFIHDVVNYGDISFCYVESRNQLADTFTKMIGNVRFKEIRSRLKLM